MTAVLPSLGVVVGPGAATVFDVMKNAEGLANPVFLFDEADTDLFALRDQLAEMSSCRTVRHGRVERGEDLDGIVTFSESKVTLTAEVAAHHELAYHSPETAHRVRDKGAQRAALAAAQIEVRCGIARDPGEVIPIIDRLGGPCIIKPLDGLGSRHTYSCAPDIALPDLPADAFPMIVEELLPTGAHPEHDDLADYVSVETIFHEGEPHHLAITDKLPLASPFRETGYVFPSTLPTAVQGDLFAMTERALDALGITHGMTHTELKLTRGGKLAVIEVNARLGGFIGRLAEIATGTSAVRHALAAALGQARPPWPKVVQTAAHWMIPPPQDATELASSVPVRELKEIPGVLSVEVHRRAGSPVDYRQGTLARVATVWYAGATYPQVAETYRAARHLIEERLQWK
ncbi:ATP-grasp domain-containing protein [Nocardioides carbamazepini]|uniref:ATP-grasp domain-containing protein n=1 Tax=Nocardioides carbamazepini TaxID=2854259 RepID=UPI00214A7E58|nr:ATP-grasp domain-containing protein [Nocardioides carbamazepini]MCR1785002.1 ATP-grasp domain-containing protein [Nocardioides carbamazepini]